MARMPDGPAPPPTVQKLRIRYAKRGRLRFTSHRDIQRAFERALRRARVPMAYSAGFTPHPKVSWAGAAPTGVASEAEYVEIGVTRALVPAELAAALDGSLPADLDILEVVEAATPNLMERLEASVWEIRLPGVEPKAAFDAVAAFVAAPEVLVERMTKNGVRTFDARAAVTAMEAAGGESDGAEPAADGAGRAGGVRDAAEGDGVSAGESGVGEGDGRQDRPCAILRLVVRHLTPAVRPDDVLTGLGRVAGLVPPVPPQVTRLAQGPLRDGSDATPASVSVEALSDPLDPDRVAAGSAGER
ncbi:TIGR03936 family radical SAM-associated protein [Catenulispora sp. NL8]|uniref:TIGR03936 family radical SAM-associated protein n=2 Tax=Catenulispora pinistramenti TaxID=2705254 RepID=A0ABS5L3K3_9ACTN|nr:TIGR03936 family radical SAM-associated protein [Catenulispora pinistramenti]